MLAPCKKSYNKPRQNIKKQRHYLADKGLDSLSFSFSSSHVWIWGLDHKDGWKPKNWYFCDVVLEKTLESPFDCKEIKPISPKGNQSWIFIRRTDAEDEAPILWPPDVKSWLTGKDPNAGKDFEGRRRMGTEEDKMVGLYHQPNGHQLEQTLGNSQGRGSLACCNPWGHKESDMT